MFGVMAIKAANAVSNSVVTAPAKLGLHWLFASTMGFWSHE